MSANLGQELVHEALLLIRPVVAAAKSREYRARLLESLGYQLEAFANVDQTVAGAMQALVTAYERARPLLENPPDTLEELKEALATLSRAVEPLQQLQQLGPQLEALQIVIPELDDIVQRFLDHLTLSFLFTHHPVIYRLARLFTLIGDAAPAGAAVLVDTGATVYAPTAHEEVRWIRLLELLRDPLLFFRHRVLGDGTLNTADEARFIADRLFPQIAFLCKEMGLNAVYGYREGEHPDGGAAGNDMMAGALTIEMQPPPGEEGPRFGVVLYLSSADRGNLGLVVVPIIGGSGTLDLNEWALKIDFNIDGAMPAFAVGPQGVLLDPEAGLLRVSGRLTLVKGTEGEAAAFILGSNTGTRLEVGDFRIHLPFDFSAAAQDFGLEVSFKKAAVVLAAAEGDGFLQKVLPKDGLRADFELDVGWSKRRGFYVSGNAGLEGTIPVHKTLFNTITIDTISVGLLAGTRTGGLTAYAGTSASLKLGPVVATIEKAGIEATITFRPGGGNLGPADLDLDFKPPSGVGIAIDAGQVTGGGYLFLDRVNQQYAGVLQLELAGGISVKAIGLLTTKMPDGSKGFSLLVLVTAEGFTPIALGMGFSLTGVGGMVGLNRTAMVDVLRTGLRNRTLSSVLSPKDPIKNAPRIVSDLRASFPPAEGQFLFGPLVTIAWGVGNIVTFNLALILELPRPVRLLLLAQIKALLPVPDEEKALIRLQMDALGAIEFDRGLASLDAVLYDSRIGPFAISGAMALRAGWGANPIFLLSVGGFNPRFKPPQGFPAVERLAISLARSDSLMVRLEAYMALTSNTVQFGSKLQLHAEAMGFALDGFLGFDALFQLSPFQFVVDIAGGLALKRGNKLLMQIMVAILLSGPNPFHIRGKASFEVLLFKATISFDKTIGRATPLPPPPAVAVQALLNAALLDQRNWRTQMPDAEQALVTLRQIPAGTGLVLGHPLGSLTFSQKAAPLNRTLQTYGGAPIADADPIFVLGGIQVGGKAPATRVSV
ncbi:MAG TPA: DUF6603 domain-containing protein, partial [Symbiobacteriaceae bacterium]|nr:DUF6603 domain-containing protein [Symbiobacteriaceae bacterium]